MILVSLSGGIGNQLFQYAAGRSLAMIHKTPLIIDTSWYRVDHKNLTSRNLDIFKFKLTDELIEIKSLTQSRVLRTALAARAFIPLKRLGYSPFSELNSFVFDPAFLLLPKNVFLNGYWQSWRYFENISDILANELMISSSLSDADLSVLKRIQEVNSVGVHVRRGDYLESKTLQICDVEYYLAGAEKIRKISGQHGELSFFVFSDDIEWAKKNLQFPENTEYVAHNDESSCVNDLILLSSCQNNIIANSSFSWWAAWIGCQKSEGRVIVAPDLWGSGVPVIGLDIYPEDWNVINCL